MSVAESLARAEAYGTAFDARSVMDVIDEIITDVYLPFRGADGFKTERAVLIAEPHTPHRENDAEHSWNLASTVGILWDNRHRLGIPFTPSFNIDKAVRLAVDHDVFEIWSDDINAMTRDRNLVELKREREEGVYKYIMQQRPTLVGIAQRWAEYQAKSTPEAQFVSDLDKILATRLIFLDGGKQWHDWEGQRTSRDRMLEVIRGKLLTDFGHALFEVQEYDISRNPGVFPNDDDDNEVDEQLRIF